MEICWDNLETLKYNNNVWVKGHICYYVYKESCKHCGAPYLTSKYQPGKFCSITCARIYMWTGKQHSEETRKKISKTLKGKYVGVNSPSWKSSISNEERQIGRKYPEYYEWREAVYKRDNYTCQICGQVKGDINAHHLESYNSNPKLRTTLSNGITLCKKCHLDFHHQYGKGNNTKEQFEEFINYG